MVFADTPSSATARTDAPFVSAWATALSSASCALRTPAAAARIRAASALVTGRESGTPAG
jgi:hypothetical protein